MDQALRSFIVLTHSGQFLKKFTNIHLQRTFYLTFILPLVQFSPTPNHIGNFHSGQKDRLEVKQFKFRVGILSFYKILTTVSFPDLIRL
jgi:hypothetical protein